MAMSVFTLNVFYFIITNIQNHTGNIHRLIGYLNSKYYTFGTQLTFG